MMCIYKIENLINGKIYIGSAKNFSKRKSRHINRLKNKKHHSPKLQYGWDKHGESNFIFNIIEIVDDINKLLEREQFYINSLNPFYNCCNVAGNRFGKRLTEESKRIISESVKAYYINGGIPSQLGIIKTKSEREKISKSLMKPIVQYSISGERIKNWDGAPLAENELGILSSDINQCCNGKTQTCGGFRWTFLDQELRDLSSHKRSIPIIKIDGLNITEFRGINEASRITGISSSGIGLCCNGKRKTAGGFIWRFKINNDEC